MQRRDSEDDGEGRQEKRANRGEMTAGEIEVEKEGKGCSWSAGETEKEQPGSDKGHQVLWLKRVCTVHATL